jgi:hypothetical protein
MANVNPVFLFSLPRSGSTLTQRVLATHPGIGTASEPWVLLPFLYSMRRQGMYAEYGHGVAAKAIEDFAESLRGGKQAYLQELREFVLRLYARHVTPGTTYFLDKTPRYHLVADEILSLFPESRVVFLWRNPLAVIASMIETWGKGRWNLYLFEIDLYDGVDKLVRAYDAYKDRACSARYEELIDSTEPWERMFAYLGLDFDASQLGLFSGVSLKGRMGDPTGQKAYDSLSSEPLDKWKRVLASPARKAWCRRYLHWLGRERLGIMGYDLDRLIEDLDSIPSNYRPILSDIARMLFGVVFRYAEPVVLRDKFTRLLDGKRNYPHY